VATLVVTLAIVQFMDFRDENPAALTNMAMAFSPHPRPIQTLRNVKVLRTLSEYEYSLQESDGTVIMVRFCTDYEPQFDAGMTLTLLNYQDRGNCWSLLDLHPKYTILRDDTGKVIKFTTN
jgi:hypothetical protein